MTFLIPTTEQARCGLRAIKTILGPTGGLGPTKDDITKKTLAEMFHSRLVIDPTVEEHVRRMLEARGIEDAFMALMGDAAGLAP